MTDIHLPSAQGLVQSLRKSVLWSAWGIILLILLAIALFDTNVLVPTVGDALASLLHTAPFILFAVLAVAYMKASGSEAVLASAFQGRESRMIVLGAVFGGLSPFCSCEVIPFVAALLAVGVPLSAVMAFWLASPLMDPAMFFITSAALGVDFAVAKAVAAIAMGILGGGIVRLFATGPVFSDPLRDRPAGGGCCSARSPFTGAPVWRFWQTRERRDLFGRTALENGLFLAKWLLLAYVLESLMLRYVPADLIGSVLGGSGVWPILLGALVGAPAYLNGYAAVPLVGALMDQGMSPGAAMSFVVAGGVSCIPAAVAVWALVKPRVFAAYLGIALLGAVLAGLGWNAIA